MGATIDGTPSLNAMTDHGALAVRTTRRHCMNCIFEAVECHGLSSLRDLERLIVVVTAYITNGHENKTLRVKRLFLATLALQKRAPAGCATAGAPTPRPLPLGYGERLLTISPDAESQTLHRAFVPNYTCNADLLFSTGIKWRGHLLGRTSGVWCRPTAYLMFNCSICTNGARSKYVQPKL